MGDAADAGQTLFVDAGKDYPDGTRISASFELPSVPPAVVVLFGPSGAGKTTLLRLIAGLESPSWGMIRYGTEVWSEAGKRSQTSPQARRVGYLSQDYALFPHMSVSRNIAYGLGELSMAQRLAQIRAIGERLGITGLLDKRPGELSGGEQQRVALARALVRRPRFVMLDEPFAALDAPTREDVRSWVGGVFRDLDVPAIIVTHDWSDALNLGDRMVVMGDGRILQEGTPRDVLTRPIDAEVARIVGVDTIVPSTVVSRRDGALHLEAGGARVTAVDPGGGGARYWMCIRGEDVVLERGVRGTSSARNRLSGIVIETRLRGALVEARVDVGFQLNALVTRQAAVDLDLETGQQVVAAFKASVVHLVPRERVSS